jgi:hypothetical protein
MSRYTYIANIVFANLGVIDKVLIQNELHACVSISSATLTCLQLVSYKQYITSNGNLVTFYACSEMQEYEYNNS